MESTPPAPLQFFKPLLPEFLHEFLIPDAFFQHHFDGCESRCVILKTISGKNWPVNLVGRRFADGWPEFASGHDLQVGDFLVFALQGTVFYVKVFGRNACERLYPLLDVEESYSMESDENSEDEYMAESDDEKFSEKSSEDSMASFEGTVTSLNVLHIPKLFAEMNDLNNRCCKMVLIAKGGRSWRVRISCGKGGETIIRSGWHQFCQSNSLKVGDVFTFEMVDDGSQPIVSISIGNTADIEHSRDKKVPNVEDASESNENFSVGSENMLPSFEGIVYSPTSLYIPKSFAEANGLSNRRCKVALTAGGSKCWIVKMVCGGNGETLIRRGWARFCQSNSLTMGDRFAFELIDNGAQPIASILYSKHSVNPDAKTGRYMATIYSRSIKYSRLYVPKRFSELHDFNNKICPMVLRNTEGRSWPAFLGFQRSNNQVYIGQGWDKFRDANGFKVGDTVMVEVVMKKPELVIKIYTVGLTRSGDIPESATYVSRKMPKECFVVAASNPRRKGSQLRFPTYFSKENKLREEIGKDVILRNEKGIF